MFEYMTVQEAAEKMECIASVGYSGYAKKPADARYKVDK